MSNLKLTIATTDYDHFRDFRLGVVKAEGIDHTWLNLVHHECFARFTANREFDLSELSFAKFSAQVNSSLRSGRKFLNWTANTYARRGEEIGTDEARLCQSLVKNERAPS